MVDSQQVPASQGAERRASTGGSGSGRAEVTNEAELEAKTLRIAGLIIFVLLGIFLVCAIFEGVRLLLCSVQLIVIGLLSCIWEEESFTPSSSMPSGRRMRHLFCQFWMVLLPIVTGVWLAVLGVSSFLPDSELEEAR